MYLGGNRRWVPLWTAADNVEHDPFRLGEPNTMCRSMPLGRTRPIELIVHTLLYTPNVSFELILELTVVGATDTKRTHLVTRRNMECFQGLAILIAVCSVCTVMICALQILCFFLLKRTRNVSSSRINEDLNGHNREPGKPRQINTQWPHLNRRKQPIEHSEQPFH